MADAVVRRDHRWGGVSRYGMALLSPPFPLPYSCTGPVSWVVPRGELDEREAGTLSRDPGLPLQVRPGVPCPGALPPYWIALYTYVPVAGS